MVQATQGGETYPVITLVFGASVKQQTTLLKCHLLQSSGPKGVTANLWYLPRLGFDLGERNMKGQELPREAAARLQYQIEKTNGKPTRSHYMENSSDWHHPP